MTGNVNRLREILRWWPLILIPALIAVSAAVWSASRQHTTYTATARLAIVPLVQWDETFLGTSLIRDAGDAKRTATTVAALLDSHQAATTAAEYLGHDWTPQSVNDAITVSVVDNTNVVEVAATTDDPDTAARVSEGFAKATLEDRWRTVSEELDERIATLTAAQPISDDAAARLGTLTAVRDGSSDPTLRLTSTSPAVANPRPSTVVVVSLAAVGGLFIGLLAAIGMVGLQHRRQDAADATSAPDSTAASAYSSSDRS